MRRPKFRVWTGEEFREDDSFCITSDGYCNMGGEVHEEWIVLEYTGLKDKNGTEICEGDIVTCPKFADPYKIAVVVFGAGCFRVATIQYYDQHSLGEMDLLYSIVDQETFYDKRLRQDNHIGDDVFIGQVLGNIYENPELLK